MVVAICVALVLVLFIMVILLIDKDRKVKTLETKLKNSNGAVEFQKLLYESLYERHKKLEVEHQFLKSTMYSNYGSPTFVSRTIKNKTGE